MITRRRRLLRCQSPIRIDYGTTGSNMNDIDDNNATHYKNNNNHNRIMRRNIIIVHHVFILLIIMIMNYYLESSSSSHFVVMAASTDKNMVSCETDEDCVAAIRIGSHCIVETGYCSNPFHKGGCLSNMMTANNVSSSNNKKIRVCTSLDTAETYDNGYCIHNNEWMYNEIRILGNNWESVFFETWIIQILLSEMLMIPTSVESGTFNKYVDFYDINGRIDYGTGYNWDALRIASNHTDCKSISSSSNTTTEENYVPCAHVSLEVWEGQLENMAKLYDENVTEKTQPLGLLGNGGYYVPKFTAAQDPTLLTYLGLSGESNRIKLAETFLRPTTWYQYCYEVSDTNCTVPDTVATRAPINDQENVRMFVNDGNNGILYTGYFRKTYENDCDTYPNNCTGHIVDYPCGWSSFVQQQTYWLNISLRGSGSEPICRGYPYNQMIDIWNAANYTKSNVMMLYWTPDSLVQQYAGTDSEFQKVNLPLPTQECFDNRVSTLDRCEENITLRIGNSKGVCDDQTQILMKVLTKKLYDISYNNINEALHSPAYDTIKNFQITGLQLGVIFQKWIQNENAEAKSFLNPREAVCEWFIENYELIQSFIPKTYPRTIETNNNNIKKEPIFIITILISCIVMIYIIIIIIMTYQYRKNTIMIVSQVEFLFLVLSGLLLIQCGSIVLAIQPPSNISCSMAIWYINIGYTLELVPLAVKVAALNRLMTAARQMKRLKINRTHLFGVVALFTIIIIIYLTIWTILDPFIMINNYVLTDNINNNGETIVLLYQSCQSNDTYWIIITLLWRTLLMLWATILAFQTRNSPTNFNESKTLAFMLYSQFIFFFWCYIMYVLLSNDMISSSHILLYQSLIYSFDVAAVCTIYFVPKLYNNKDSNNNYNNNDISSDDCNIGMSSNSTRMNGRNSTTALFHNNKNNNNSNFFSSTKNESLSDMMNRNSMNGDNNGSGNFIYGGGGLKSSSSRRQLQDDANNIINENNNNGNDDDDDDQQHRKSCTKTSGLTFIDDDNNTDNISNERRSSSLIALINAGNLSFQDSDDDDNKNNDNNENDDINNNVTVLMSNQSSTSLVVDHPISLCQVEVVTTPKSTSSHHRRQQQQSVLGDEEACDNNINEEENTIITGSGKKESYVLNAIESFYPTTATAGVTDSDNGNNNVGDDDDDDEKPRKIIHVTEHDNNNSRSSDHHSSSVALFSPQIKLFDIIDENNNSNNNSK